MKDLFWSEDETVIQFHPPKSEYVNQHPYVLHLWRNRVSPLQTPPSVLVGVKDVNNPTAEEVAAMARWTAQADNRAIRNAKRNLP